MSGAARGTDDGRAAAPEISLDRLMRDLADPAVPKESLIPYLTMRRDRRVGLAPVLLPNEKVDTDSPAAVQARVRGELGMGFLNSVFQARRRRRFEQRIAARDAAPVLMAEGDSWFQYPIFLDDVVDALEGDHNVYCLSSAGAELSTMVADAEYRDHLLRLKERVRFRAFLFSGAGNDVVGDQMRGFLAEFRAGAAAGDYIRADTFDRKTAEILRQYTLMIESVRAVLPDVPILIHGYDYSIPLPAQPFSVPPRDGWLGVPMRALRIPDGQLQAEIVHVMMDLVNAALQTLARETHGGRHAGVYFVDNRNTVGANWADELHPNNVGFRAVAANFRKVLRQAGVA